MAFIAGSLWGEHRNVSLSPEPIIVSGDPFYMGSPADHNQQPQPKRKIGTPAKATITKSANPKLVGLPKIRSAYSIHHRTAFGSYR